MRLVEKVSRRDCKGKGNTQEGTERIIFFATSALFGGVLFQNFKELALRAVEGSTLALSRKGFTQRPQRKRQNAGGAEGIIFFAPPQAIRY